MRLIRIIAIFSLTAGPVLRGAGDEATAEYKPLMKSAAGAVDQLKSALKEQDAAAARTSSEELSRRMTAIVEFWSRRNDTEAAGWATNVKKAADDIASKTAAGDFAGATSLLESARETCESCHKVHRKMSLGGWKLK